MTIKELLNNMTEKTNDLDKKHSLKWLMLSYLNMSYSDYYLNENKILNEKEIQEYKKMSNKYLTENIPVQYLVNKSYFYNYEFYINENVLIPRAETEMLVEYLNNFINEKYKNKTNVKILDLATGSGIIGITLKLLNENFDVTLSDISIEALKVAETNINNYNLNIKTIQSDWLENINEKYDVIVSNPPYIKKNYSLEPHVLKEPHIALFSGNEGLDSYKEILKKIEKNLKEEYIVAFEHGYDQKDKIKTLINQNIKEADIVQMQDLYKKDRYTFIIK